MTAIAHEQNDLIIISYPGNGLMPLATDSNRYGENDELRKREPKRGLDPIIVKRLDQALGNASSQDRQESDAHLYVAGAQVGPTGEPNGVLDDLGRKSTAFL